MVAVTQVDERLVAELWERQLLEQEDVDAHGLTVVYGGTPSDAGGPDYQDALLCFGHGSPVQGDVEFHVRAGDWYRHGHHQNPRYNGVVLHVVWEVDTAVTRRNDGETVPVIRVQQALGPSEGKQNVLLEHPCVSSISALAPDELEVAVGHAADLRLDRLIDRYRVEILDRGADEVLYTAILESMGYASNRPAFRALAEAVPFGWLRGIPSGEWCATLLDAAGFGAQAPHAPPARLSETVWRTARIRPGNHPAARVAAASALLVRHAPRPAERFCRAVHQRVPRQALRTLVVVSDGGHGAIGTGRADEVVASVILPFCGAFPDVEAGARAVWAAYYAPPSTRWTRAATRLLREAGQSVPVRTCRTHQGLHELYTQHCRYRHQSGCPVCSR